MLRSICVLLALAVCQLILCNTISAHTCDAPPLGISSARTFYVSPSGNDRNSGKSEAKPLKLVQAAVDKMKSGDTLVVLDGVYTGRLKVKSGITIQAKNPRKVVFSGAERLTGEFEKHSENIYKIKVGKDIERVFYQDEPMTWAQWPNISWAENWQAHKRSGWARPRDPAPVQAYLACDAFSKLNGLGILVGGYVFLRYSKGNSCYSRQYRVIQWQDHQLGRHRLLHRQNHRRGWPKGLTGSNQQRQIGFGSWSPFFLGRST